MTIESDLCRELDIRFIDARALKMEAMVSLKIDGYASRDQHGDIVIEAMKLFNQRSNNDQMKMRRQHWDLEAQKIPTGSMSMSDVHDSGTSDISAVSSHSTSSFAENSILKISKRRR